MLHIINAPIEIHESISKSSEIFFDLSRCTEVLYMCLKLRESSRIMETKAYCKHSPLKGCNDFFALLSLASALGSLSAPSHINVRKTEVYSSIMLTLGD